MSAAPPQIIGVGECMVEFYGEGPLGDTEQLARRYGGDVLNALVTAARLGTHTGFVTRVGDDPFGPALRSAWAAEGIDLTHAPLVPGENGVYFISLLSNGQREFTYRRSGSAASMLAPEHIHQEYVAAGQILLLSGVTQAISATARAATLHAARTARRNGVLVAYDPNYRPRLWAAHGGETEALAAFHEVSPFVDVLLPSYPDDLTFLAARTLSVQEALDALVRHAPLVALKAGADGAWLAQANDREHIPSTPVERVLDSTGAGDAWNGAFLSAITKTATYHEAARHANRVAAFTTQHRGAIPPPFAPDDGLTCSTPRKATPLF